MSAPITASDVTRVLSGSPVLTNVHFSPRLLDRMTLPSPSRAKMSVPTAANPLTPILEKPVSRAAQLFPWSSDRKTPAPAREDSPANMSVPTAAKEIMLAFGGKPVLTGVQLSPLSSDRKTPLPRVPATIYVPLTARALIPRLVKPELTATHLSS